VLVEKALMTDNGSAAVSISDDGVLTYLGGSSRETDSRLTWFDRSGKALATEGPVGPPSPAALSPDEKTAAVLRRQVGLGVGDVWLRDLSRGVETRLTVDNATDYRGNMVWSPDSARIAFSSPVSGSADLYMKDVRASGASEPIFRNANRKFATDWSREGFLFYTEIDPKTRADLWYLPLKGSTGENAKPVAFLQTEFDESFGQISPDGRWIAYISNESGRYDVYVRSFPAGAGKWQVSLTGTASGTTQQPRWSPDGKELFYVTGSGGTLMLMAAPVRFGRGPSGAATVFETGAPEPLFNVRINSFAPAAGTFFYSVSKDGQRFLINHVEAASEPVLNVVVNWDQTVVRN
jgi:Tol biopolymer transport system component